MKKAIVFLLIPICAAFVLGLLVTPQTKVQHQDSSAFQVALQGAVDRLEGSGELLLAGTATPVHAAPQQPTFDRRYTCDTYEPGLPTCDASCGEHTTDPLGHTCLNEAYTCQQATCDTYDPQAFTCDRFDPACGPVPPPPHTFEPAPYNHTCDGHTCDAAFTCDFTVDPRAYTCDAADPQCEAPTFYYLQPTCNPMLPECRINNPLHCTSQAGYPTCEPGLITCDPGDPLCATVDPADPRCGTPVEETTWGQIKTLYEE
jgi:hypothetical protein